MALPQAEQQIIDSLTQSIGLSGANLDWVSKALRLFAVPDTAFARYLFEALARIAHGVPWFSELPDGREQRDALERVLGQLAEAKAKTPGLFPDLSDRQIQNEFSGEFAMAGTFHGAGGRARGLEALRAVLWICNWRWTDSANPRSSAIESVASAIRGIVRHADGAIEPQILLKLGQATSLADFIAAAEPIKTSRQALVAAAWADHIHPELAGIARVPGERSVRPKGTGAPPLLPISPAAGPLPGSEPSSSQKSPGFDEDREIEALQAKVRYGYIPGLANDPPPFQGELAEEHQSSVHTASLPAAPRHKDAGHMLRHQMQQAVWSSNFLLLPNHPDVLQLDFYGRVVRQIIAELRQAEPGSGAQFGLAALLIQAITGRTPRALTAFDVLSGEVRPHDSHRMEFLPEKGVFRISVFWQVAWQGQEEPSFFKPEECQLKHVEPVASVFLLPVAPPILEVLRTATSALEALSHTEIGQIEACLREAARHVSLALGKKFTSGQLRASLSAHLFEQSRDTAITQLLCADALSPSKAPLSYYAPRTRDVAVEYWKIQQWLLDQQFSIPELVDGDSRVGARLMARQDSAVEMARAPSAPLNFGIERLASSGRGRDVHIAILNHFGAMLIGALTHRPGEALFALTRDQFWINGDIGGALFRDKVHDAAHDPRLVALPATVCRQIQAYLEHLQGLAERYPAFKEHVAKVLSGQAPLLFGWSEEDKPAPLTYMEWKNGLPECWRVLPLNWGRHWLRTRAIEEGARPELVNIQLGHLEAIGYPFSGASPTEPEAFIAELAPAWERLVRLQGWKVVRGFTATGTLVTDIHTPLVRWKEKVLSHEASAREETRSWQQAMQSRLRSYKEAALAHVLLHPELVEKEIVARFNTADPDVTAHVVTRGDFERIRDELYESAGDDTALALARADALCRVARKVNKRTGQSGHDPAPLIVLRRPVDNAFLPGMMKAVRQIHALRDHLKAWSSNNKHGDWRDFPLACARVVTAMTLFGFCDDPNKIQGAIERRHKLQRPATLVDAILVPYGDEPHEVLGLRGIAAIVFARLAWKHPTGEFPGWNAINRHVKEFLPDWVVGTDSCASADGTGLLGLLCETVAVANRFELSPAARRALSDKGGTTDAHINEQVALIDGDPVGTIQRDWEDDDGRLPPAPRGSFGRPGTGNSRSQYLALCSVLPSPDKDTSLPLTGVSIPSGQAAADVHRAAIVKEIDAMLEEDAPKRRLQPIVQLLAGWTRDMLLNGTARTPTPAFKTIETYLTRVGGGLVEIFGQSSLYDLDEAELEDAYVAVISAQKKSRSKTAAAILGLHHFGLIEFDLPDVDLSGVFSFLRAEGQNLADARLIMPSEREAVLAELERQSREPRAAEGTSRNDTRLIRQANAVLPLMAYGGARRSEALGLQFRDISHDGEHVHVQVRANSSRRMKTARGRRRLDLPAELFASGPTTLTNWANNERSRLSIQRSETAFVFAPLDDSRSAKERNEVADTCLRVCRTVTGRRHARLHGFRHLVGMEQTLPAFLSAADQEALSSTMRLAPLITKPGLAVLPRDVQAQILSLGHNRFDTTLQWYHHLGWLLRSRSDARMSDRWLGRDVLATLLGVTGHTLDWGAKQAAGTPKSKAWLDVQWQSRKVPKKAEPPTRLIAAAPPMDWTARELGALLADAARLGSLSKALQARGADTNDADRIRQVILPLESRLGRRLLQDEDIPDVAGRPNRSIRQLDSAGALEILWDWYDEDRDGLRNTLSTLAESVAEHLYSPDLDKIRLPSPQAAELERLLGLAMVNRLSVRREVLAAGLELVRVPRPEGKNEDMAGASKAATRFLGLEIKRILLVIRLASKAL